MSSDLVKQGKELVMAIAGQNKGVDGRMISLSYTNQLLITRLVEALEKAEKRMVILEDDLEHYKDRC